MDFPKTLYGHHTVTGHPTVLILSLLKSGASNISWT